VLGSVAEKVLQSASWPLLLVPARAHAAVPADVSYRTIVVPLDGSQFAEQALGQAQAIAATTGAVLVLISVVPLLDDLALTDVGIVPAWAEAERQEEIEQRSSYLAGVAARLEAEGFTVQPHVVGGTPTEQILHASAAEHADLIVMATHGHTGVQRLWIGSVATKVVRSADRPVLLVRAHEQSDR
jgi:nucleotide-binding universal stress UspA family protein